MSILGTLFNTNPIAAGSSVIGQAVKDIVGTFHLSPESKLEFDRAVAENEFKLKQMDAELESKLAETAGQNIRAETSSSDKFTSRARPAFLYVVELVFIFNYIIAPIFNKTPIVLPGDLLVLFGFVMMGYVGGRSWEKIALAKLTGDKNA